jgi:transposase-like protein
MLSTTVVHTCRHCGSERLQKNGHTAQGAQRAKCLACGRTFILSPKGPRYSEEFKGEVVAAYQDRMSIRGLTRTFGVCYQTVIAWVGEKMATLPAFEDALLPSESGDVLELDELWSFVEKKTKGVLVVGGALPAHPPDRRLHGGRSQPGGCRELARARARRLPPPLPRAATTGWLTQKLFPGAPTVSAARPKARPTTPNAGLGPCGRGYSRLVRRAYSFSKSIERHLEAIHLFIVSHNLQIKRSTAS